MSGSEKSSTGRRDAAAKIWRWPIVLAVVSTAGLISALVGDGLWDALSWITLGAPVIVTAWFLARRQKRTTR